ncbi:MAG TPA: secondary thiamine-phosphate synthase enzyme YjbQ [Syntrophales bacterium]|nr:secondary thiamine-phosphate synthase enzyme YjbQ [Syntrophales bacterium]HOP34996.1 secondary thiamine-phosphate synthase enzyme YjbQ [Syntrophales bacterium]
MKIRTMEIELSTAGNDDVVDITAAVEARIGEAGIIEGTVIVFVPGSTGGLTTIEYESGVVRDLKEALERLVPRGISYHHDARWGDGNGHSHVRASLVGPSLAVPVSGGRMTLGTWQQIVFIDFDNRPRRRSLVVQVSGRS